MGGGVGEEGFGQGGAVLSGDDAAGGKGEFLEVKEVALCEGEEEVVHLDGWVGGWN